MKLAVMLVPSEEDQASLQFLVLWLHDLPFPSLVFLMTFLKTGNLWTSFK